ncbi:MAG: hypothetical protein OHK0013_14030 [Sandaracinaceae bacterium]
MSYLFHMRAHRSPTFLHRTRSRSPLARGVAIAVGVSTSTAALGACNHADRRYLAPEGATVFALAFTPDTPPFFMGDEESLYLIETPVMLPIRPPSAAEEAALGDGPWVRRGDYQVQLTFTVTNLDTERARFVGVTLNGINPLYEYVPGFTVDDDDVIPNFSQWERTYVLEPGESRTVTVREEEIDEMTVDLASATSTPECQRIANQIVYFANQAGIDPRSTACIPEVVPGLLGIKLGLRAVGSEPPPIVLEASAIVRDVRDRIAASGQEPWEPPMPTPFTPPPPEE